ncbi:MAG: hypothetical protein ACRD2J_04310 [Thermoanaerobaculia bacterium]
MRPLAIVCAALIAACTPEQPASTEPVAPPAAAAPIGGEPKDLTATEVETTIPIGGPPFVSAVRIGTAPTGRGTVVTESDVIPAGEPLHVVMELRDNPPGAAYEVVVRHGDRKLVEKRQDLPDGSLRATFTLETDSWPVGEELTVEAFRGGTKAAEETIRIE